MTTNQTIDSLDCRKETLAYRGLGFRDSIELANSKPVSDKTPLLLITDKRKSIMECLLELDKAVQGCNHIYYDIPSVRIVVFYGLYRWVQTANEALADNLDHLKKGVCKEVINPDYCLMDKDRWLNDNMKRDVAACGHLLLKDCGVTPIISNDDTFADLYELFEAEIIKMIDYLKEAKELIKEVHLFDSLFVELKKQHSDPHFVYEFESLRDEQIEYDFQSMVEMQVQVCVNFLNSGALNEAVTKLSNGSIDEVDEKWLYKLLSPKCKTPENLKDLWAMLKKFIEVKDNVLIVYKRDCIRRYIIKNLHLIKGEHFRALFRLDYMLMRIHEDMVKVRPELAKYLVTDTPQKVEEKNYFAVVRNILESMRKDWFWDLRTDKKYNKTWIENFLNALMATEWGERIAREWRRVSSRVKLECKIIGTLIDAGVLGVSYNAIASMLDYPDFTDDSLGIYIGLGKKEAYFKWVCEYVKA